MSIAFGAGDDNVPKGSMERILPLLPLLTKAVEIGRTFARLKARYTAALAALDHVKVGLAIALPSGEIIVQNEEAARILSVRDGLTKSADGRLRCHDPDQNAKLLDAIEKASGTVPGESQVSEMLMALKRPSCGEPLLIDVAPLKDGKAEIDKNLDGAMITLIDPDRVPYLRMDRFVVLYQLTAAEAEVCRLTIQGKSIKEMADQPECAADNCEKSSGGHSSKDGGKPAG